MSFILFIEFLISFIIIIELFLELVLSCHFHNFSNYMLVSLLRTFLFLLFLQSIKVLVIGFIYSLELL
jgi:hypothetical protein